MRDGDDMGTTGGFMGTIAAVEELVALPDGAWSPPVRAYAGESAGAAERWGDLFDGEFRDSEMDGIALAFETADDELERDPDPSSAWSAAWSARRLVNLIGRRGAGFLRPETEEQAGELLAELDAIAPGRWDPPDLGLGDGVRESLERSNAICRAQGQMRQQGDGGGAWQAQGRRGQDGPNGQEGRRDAAQRVIGVPRDLGGGDERAEAFSHIVAVPRPLPDAQPDGGEAGGGDGDGGAQPA